MPFRFLSLRKAYLRGDRGDVDGLHAFGSRSDEPRVRDGRIRDEPVYIDAVAERGEGTEAFDAFFDERGCAVEIAIAPMVEANTDLEDPVIQPAHRRARVAPEELERLVLLKEFANVEFVDASN